MFSRKKDDEKIESIIGLETRIVGTVYTKGILHIQGQIEGGVGEASNVIISKDGVVQGDVTAQNVIIGGKINGNVTAEGTIEIAANAEVYGDIHTLHLSIEEGAIFEGNCVMNKPKVVIEKKEHEENGTTKKTSAK